MVLRAATFDDWKTLLEWRNDELTRLNSINTDIVQEENHKRWLSTSLQNPDRKLLIAEVEGIPVGTVRIDNDNEVCELSWTIAPNQRGKGYGKQMLKQAIEQLNRPAIAHIKKENIPSIKMAESIGMTLVKDDNGLLEYSL